MANRFKGEVSATVAGKVYTLVMNWNAMAEFETMTGKNAMLVIQTASLKSPMSFTDTRAIVWASMRKHHPEATLEDAGDLLSEDMGLVGALIESSAPPDEPGNGKAPAPKKAPARR